MLKRHVKTGGTYIVKISGKLCNVKLVSESPYGGWNGVNLSTGRSVHIRTAAKLRSEVLS